MRYLLVLAAFVFSIGTAAAQTEKTAVSKLPGEENLSVRERAERDFLMPVRRQKVAAEPKTIGEELTAAPEADGATTAHFNEAPVAEARNEEAGTAHEARVAHVSRVVHATRHSNSRSRKAKSHKVGFSKAKSNKSHPTNLNKHPTKSKAKNSKKNSKKSRVSSNSHKNNNKRHSSLNKK